jgi:hypothetical protein
MYQRGGRPATIYSVPANLLHVAVLQRRIKLAPGKGGERDMAHWWQQTRRHLGSTLAFVFGLASFVSVARNPQGGTWIAGVVMMLGALAYWSAKKRKLGEVKSTLTRQCLEVALLVLICLAILLQNDLIYRIESDPVPNNAPAIWRMAIFMWSSVSVISSPLVLAQDLHAAGLSFRKIAAELAALWAIVAYLVIVFMPSSLLQRDASSYVSNLAPDRRPGSSSK